MSIQLCIIWQRVAGRLLGKMVCGCSLSLQCINGSVRLPCSSCAHHLKTMHSSHSNRAWGLPKGV